MSNYPESFDTETTLPPAYSADATFSAKFSCSVNPGTFAILKNPVTNQPFILDPNKTTSLRVSCFIAPEDDPTIGAQYVKYMAAFCALTGEVVIVFDEQDFAYDPGGEYQVVAQATNSSILEIKVTNSNILGKRVKVSALIEYFTQ